MKRLILAGATTLAAAVSGQVLADDDTGASYVSPMVQWWDIDKDREAKSNVGGEVALGHNFSPDWALELEVAAGSFSAKNSSNKLTLGNVTIDALRKFLPDSTVHPYVLIGGGGYSDHLTGLTTTGSFGAEAGVGLLTDLGPKMGSTRWQLRTEVIARRPIRTSVTGSLAWACSIRLASRSRRRSWRLHRRPRRRPRRPRPRRRLPPVRSTATAMACRIRSTGARTPRRATRSPPTGARSRTRSTCRA